MDGSATPVRGVAQWVTNRSAGHSTPVGALSTNVCQVHFGLLKLTVRMAERARPTADVSELLESTGPSPTHARRQYLAKSPTRSADCLPPAASPVCWSSPGPPNGIAAVWWLSVTCATSCGRSAPWRQRDSISDHLRAGPRHRRLSRPRIRLRGLCHRRGDGGRVRPVP